MTTDLAVPTESNLSRDFADMDALGSDSFFPWTKVIANNGDDVTKGRGLPGDWLLFTDKENPEKLTKTFDCICLTYRFKAIVYEKKAVKLCNYDFKSATYKDIMQKADIGKFGDDPSYNWGVELLLWIPSASNGVGVFTTYFASTKSARKAVKDKLKPLLSRKNETTGQLEEAPASVTIGSFLKVDRNKYIIPTFTQNVGVVRSPDPEDLKKALTKFLNPPIDAREVANQPQRDR